MSFLYNVLGLSDADLIGFWWEHLWTAQGLQAIVFSVVTVNDEHTKPTVGSKESVWVKFKAGIYAEMCLKLWFESD